MSESVPFDTVEEAWFWFIKAQLARHDGARIRAGNGLLQRPCEPVDILTTLDNLYRERKVTMDHLLVLRHYGRKMLAPDPRLAREVRGYKLWHEALDRLYEVLFRKGIVKERPVSQENPYLNVHFLGDKA